ncbi:MAG: T9SS type A sorting domain-containing protein [Chitinophagales bacterium]|nr:T9SS type A sorting domain-containing protein [Chitinophagales bacterium]
MGKYVLLMGALLIMCTTHALAKSTFVFNCDNDQDAPIIIYPSQDIQLTVDPCSTNGAGTIFFSAKAIDECDENPVFTVNVNTSGGSYILENPYDDTYYFIGSPGWYQLVLRATDESGNQRVEDFVIEVSQDEMPITGIGCNDTISVSLNENCQRIISPDMLIEGELGCLPAEFFDIHIEDDLIGNQHIVDGVGAFNFEITPNQPDIVTDFTGSFRPSEWYLHADTGGNTTFSSSDDSLLFSGTFAAAIYTMPYAGELSFNLGSNFNGSSGRVRLQLLDQDGMTVEETQFNSSFSQLYQLNVQAGYHLILYVLTENEGGSPISSWLVNWEFDFAEVDFGNLNSCWGVIKARDTSPPELKCPSNTDMGVRYTTVNSLSGEVTDDDPEIHADMYSCLIENFTAPGTRYYDLLEFEVDQSDYYTFFLLSDFNAGDGDMAIFSDYFNPETACSNIIAQADFPQGNNPLGGSDPFVRIALPLEAGVSYYLLTTTDAVQAMGSYEYWILSDGTGSILNANSFSTEIAYPLFCGDIGLIFNTDSIQWTGAPTVLDNCSMVSLEIEDELDVDGDCGGALINRAFSASDEQGNTSSCTQEINFRRPSLDDVSLPPFTAIIECDELFSVNEFGNPDPSHTGYPFLVTFSGVVDLNDVYCNIGASYEDGPLIETCMFSHKFIRTWTLTDWCNPTDQFGYPQIIKVGDFTPPTVEDPLVDFDGDGTFDELHYSTGPFECTAAFSAPLPVVSDNCSNWGVETEVVIINSMVLYNMEGIPIDTSEVEEVIAYIPAGSMDRFVGNVPLGCHIFRYRVTDECGNQIVHDTPFCVSDQIAPVAVCDDDLHVTIGVNGDVTLYAVNLDEGSWDNCGLDSFYVRREISQDDACNPVTPYYSPWGYSVGFTCCDVNAEVVVELRVIDITGNENICQMSVLVEDKVDPTCTPPPAVTIGCDTLPGDFVADSLAFLQAHYGIPQVSDNCIADWEELSPLINLDECGFGVLTRRFRAIDLSGNISDNFCQQQIVIEERHNYEIRFPKDAEANCGYPNPLDTISFSEIGCDLLAVSVEDDFFSASGDECYKVVRTYRVINWCEYDGESEPQLISQDEDCDEQYGEEDVWVLRRPDHTYIDRDNDENNNIPMAGEKGNICDGNTNPEGYWEQVISSGFWEYTQKIKVYDTIPPQILYLEPPAFCSEDNETCRAEVEYLFVVSDNCTPNDLDITVYYDEYADGSLDSVITDIFGVYPKWKILGDFPIGVHQFELVVTDGCGNTASATLPFEVADCLAPSPVCINGLAAPLMPTPPNTDVDGDGDIDGGALTIFAETFIASPLDDCVGPVKYSINRIGETPDPDQQSMIVTCDDLGVLFVEIYAWDAADNPYSQQPDGSTGGANYDFCETYIIVQNHLADCDGGVSIAGAVAREDNVPVESVEVILSGDDNSLWLTDSLGEYHFESLIDYYDYTVTPYKDDDDQNGLSTYDVILISNHILGIQPITSPYTLIAADVNNSGSISTLDVIQLRQVILSVETTFPNNDSWRFVPRSHVFSNPQDPWENPIPYLLNFNNLAASQVDQDFVAIKVGDIDLSAEVNSWRSIENRATHPTVFIKTMDRWLKKGENIKVDFYMNEEDIAGCQGSLIANTDVVEIENITSGLMNASNWNDQLLPNALSFSWHSQKYISEKNNLFSLNLKAKANVRLSEAISLGSQYLKAEAYGKSAALKANLQLVFPDGEQELQVYPNPTSDFINFEWQPGHQNSARLSVLDITGQIVHEKIINASYQWDARTMPAGIYIYQLWVGGEKIQSGRIAVQP